MWHNLLQPLAIFELGVSLASFLMVFAFVIPIQLREYKRADGQYPLVRKLLPVLVVSYIIFGTLANGYSLYVAATNSIDDPTREIARIGFGLTFLISNICWTLIYKKG